MPIEPLRQPVQGNRTIVFRPSTKEFPDKCELVCEDAVGKVQLRISPFNMAASNIQHSLADRVLLAPADVAAVLSAYWDWAKVAEEALQEEAEQGNRPLRKPYNLTQRAISQPRDQAMFYSSVDTFDGFAAVINKTGLPDNTILEWDKASLTSLACVDLDFHAVPFDQRPTEHELDALGRTLSPTPALWWRTQGRGLHAIYATDEKSLYAADELAVACAAELLVTPMVSLRQGTVELKAGTRHPGATQNGRQCGPIHRQLQDENMRFLRRFGKAEATEEEIVDVQREFNLSVGARLNHSYCLLDPGHESQSTPVEVREDGLICYSCAARFGNGFQSWGFVRRKLGLPGGSQQSLTPLAQAFTNFVHAEQVDYLFERILPEIPRDFRRRLHSARLKQEHGDNPKIQMVFNSFGFVRGLDAWLHADTLLIAGRPLNAKDVSILPSCSSVVQTEEGPALAPSTAEVSIHTNNGYIAGWTPLVPYLFEPIFFVHNEAKENKNFVRCYPRRRTTRDRVCYLPPQERMPLAEAEQVIEDYFPGISMTYVKALIVAKGCAESGSGDIPILWATGPTEAAKTTTARVVLEMYGENFHSMSEIPEDRLDQIFGETLDKTRLIVFDDFAKEAENYKRFHTFIIRMNRSGHTYHKLHYGERTPPINSAVLLTDWRVPAFFSHDPQFGRRVHLLRLTKRLPKSWSLLGHFVEDWWKQTPQLTKAANSLHSAIIDEFFPEGDREPFAAKMTRMGIAKLEEEVGQDESKDALRDIVRSLVLAIGNAPQAPLEVQKRLGQGVQEIVWSEGSMVGAPCTLLCDSMGDQKRSIDDLRHVLDPFQLEMPKIFQLAEGVGSIEFELKSWGRCSYIRMVESGRSRRSKQRRLNRELFATWPPTAPVDPSQPPTPPTGPEPAPEMTNDDAEPVVILDDEGPNLEDGFLAYLDYETQSECDLKKCGSYVYSEHPSTKVVCGAVRIRTLEGQLVQSIFWTEEYIPGLTMPDGVDYEHGRQFLADMFSDPRGCIVVAHNIDFEHPISINTLKLPEPKLWCDTMDLTLARGLPAGADKAGEYLFGMGKDKEGYAHMMRTCKPQKGRGRGAGYYMPAIDRDCVQKMLNYNFRDVEISEGIGARFGLQITPEWEQRVRELHHVINARGVRIDREFCETLKAFDEEFKFLAGEEVKRATGGALSPSDLLRNEYMLEQINEQLPQHLHLRNMQAASIEKLIEASEDADNPNRDLISPELVTVLKSRLLVSRAALAKVDKALDCMGKDERARAQLKYWAAHTGRWAGTHIQPQNMKRPDEDFDIPAAIAAVEAKDREKFRELCIGKPPYELLSSLVRGMFIPAPGHVFVSADFSAIEARVLMWMADDHDGMNEHRQADNGAPDVYCQLATTLYKRPITKKNKTERQAGKIGQLACGYQGGKGAVMRFAEAYSVDFAAIGIQPEDVVNAFRTRYPKVKQMWYDVEEAFRLVLMARDSRRSNRNLTARAAKCLFEAHPDRVEIHLPSGRTLTYMNARVESDPNSFHSSGTSIYYDTVVKGHVVAHKIYGGLLVENIDQAIARDLLAINLLRIEDAGYPIALHVHDEILAEVPEEKGEECAAFITQAMMTNPEWGVGIPLHTEASVVRRYGK